MFTEIYKCFAPQRSHGAWESSWASGLLLDNINLKVNIYKVFLPFVSSLFQVETKIISEK
jgi:hypothetical protein